MIVAGGLAFTHLDISALPEPGHAETALANWSRNRLIARHARQVPPSPLADNADTISRGSGLYDMECASCHGKEAQQPTPVAQSMYPRVPNLRSPAVQRLSDREMFWTVKNGIRLSGMPGFANINTDEEIWAMVDYVRSLPPDRTQKAPSEH